MKFMKSGHKSRFSDTLPLRDMTMLLNC